MSLFLCFRKGLYEVYFQALGVGVEHSGIPSS